MTNDRQQATPQQPVSAPVGDVTVVVLPIRFAQTSGVIVPTETEQATTSQWIATPEQMLTVSGYSWTTC
jgi:hypothetical protein